MTKPYELPSPETLQSMTLADLRMSYNDALVAVTDCMSDILFQVSALLGTTITTDQHLENVFNPLCTECIYLSTLIYNALTISLVTYQKAVSHVAQVEKERKDHAR